MTALIHRARELASFVPRDIERKELTTEQLAQKIITDFSTKIASQKVLLDKRMDGLEAALLHAKDTAAGLSGFVQNFGGYRTPGERITSDPTLLETFQKTGRVIVELKNLWPDFSQKTLIDSSALGYNTPGILSDERAPGIVPLARRRLTIRDLMVAHPTIQPQVSWIKELAFTNAASPQVESSAKAESSDTFQIASAKVRTIAHFIQISRQALDDVAGFKDFINQNLIYGLKLKEETELLNGDNLGDHLYGLATQATAYAGTYAASGDTKLDKLRHFIAELQVAEEQCNGLVMNPVDAHAIDLIKTEEGGANKGMYLVGDPLGGALRVPTYWSMPTVVTNSMPSGKCLAGDFSKAMIYDRLNATVDISESHSTFFTENKLAIRCEERCLLAVLRPGAFRYGSI